MLPGSQTRQLREALGEPWQPADERDSGAPA